LSQLNPKFIYFDLDDTLLNHKKAERFGLKDVHRHFEEINRVPLDALIDTYHDINRALWGEYGLGEIDRETLQRRRFEETFQALGIDPGLHEEAGTVYMNYYRNHWEWMDGAAEVYQVVASRYEVGIITNGFAETQQLKIERFGFGETARHIVISEHVGVMKPHPKIFDYATELAGCDRSDILYIGDSVNSDIVGGRQAGWKVGWFTRHASHNGEVSADIIFDDFDKLRKRLGV